MVNKTKKGFWSRILAPKESCCCGMQVEDAGGEQGQDGPAGEANQEPQETAARQGSRTGSCCGGDTTSSSGGKCCG